jgi:hypothetical protein
MKTKNKNEIYSEQWFNDGYFFPRDRATINTTCRSIYNVNPIVNSIINSHIDLPLNYLQIKFPDNDKARSFFEDQINSVGLISKIHLMMREYWVVGEVFVYAELDEKGSIWNRITIQNPDYIIVKRSVVGEPSIMLRPDENLRRIALSDREEDIKQKKQINKTILECIKQGKNIPLDDFYISHISRKISPYEIRGTSCLIPIFRTAILDYSENQTHIPEMIRNCLMDPLINNKINMSKIKLSYRMLFTALESWAEKKIFTPIAQINSLYDNKKLSIPKLSFNLESLMQDLEK